MCNIWATLDVLNSTSSILHMCVMSIERYIAICHPLYYRKHKSSRFDNVAAKIALVWLLSAMLSSCLLISGQIWPESLYVDRTCRVSWKKFQLYGSIFAFFIPLVIVLVTYTMTTARLYQKSIAHECMQELEKINLSRRGGSIRGGSLRDVIGLQQNEGAKTPEDRTREFKRSEALLKLSAKRLINGSTSSPDGSNYELVSQNGDCSRMDAIPEAHCNRMLYRGKRGSESCLPLYGQHNHRRQGSVQKHILKRGGHSSSTRSASTRSNHSGQFNPRAKSHSTRSQSHSLSSMTSANLSRENHASIVLGLVFVSFVIGWTPFFLLNLLSATCDECQPDPTVMSVFEWLGWVSSLFNPFIYTVFNRIYRRTFWNLLHGYCCWNQKRRAKWNSQNRRKFKAKVYVHYRVHEYQASTNV